MSVTIKQVEDKIINAIENDATMSAYLKTIRGYQGDLDTAIEELIMRYPATLVLFAGGNYERGGYPSGVHNRVMEFSLLVADNNLRGEKERRVGALSGHPGTYQMIEDLLAVLAGQQLGLEIEPLEPVRERSVAQGKNISVYEVVYKTSTDYDSLT